MESEVAAFCAAVYSGLVMGALYDVFRLLRLPLRGRVWNALLDAVYYALVLCLAAGALLYINGGTVRMYLLLGMGLGLYAYMRFVSRALVALAGLIWNKCKKIVAHKPPMD
ncbi:MAG: hypothetical protein LBN26_08975 [Christensenellaceae bacterium]|jgi:spore cortex biosynthesis protein YabQ|nr:hypothetical protein [Christensenellaceae bacterium]